MLKVNMLQDLEKIVRAAGAEAQAMQRHGIERLYKGERDFATAADLRSQEIMLEQLALLYPGVAVLAEEQEDLTVPTGDFFAVDPIDGTALYSLGGDQWGVTIAFISNGLPTAGVMYYPNLDLMISAEKGRPTTSNGKEIQLAVEGGLSKNFIGTDIGAWTNFDRIERYCLPIMRPALGVRTLCAALAGALDLLSGTTCAYLHPGFAKIWDFAACALAVESAGGFTCDLQGQPLVWNQLPMSAIFAGNREIAEEILELF